MGAGARGRVPPTAPGVPHASAGASAQHGHGVLDRHWGILDSCGAAFLMTWSDTEQSSSAVSDSDPSLNVCSFLPSWLQYSMASGPLHRGAPLPSKFPPPNFLPQDTSQILVPWTRPNPFQRPLKCAGRTCHHLYCPRQVREMRGNTTITAFISLPEEHVR